MEGERNTKASSLRWEILRQALLRNQSSSTAAIKRISRTTHHGFNLIPSQPVEAHTSISRDSCICYTLPTPASPKLFLTQRVSNVADLSDFEASNRYHVDTTGLVCHWPSEDVLAYYCLKHADMFRSKRVIELGSGYGLAGLVIAAITDALEVVISDGNPQVVDYLQRNIEANCGTFGLTQVRAITLHWDKDEAWSTLKTFDVIIASDCTFFKDFHKGLACTVKRLLRNDRPSEAIFFSPKRGDSLDKFLEEIEEVGLHVSVTENYDTEVWKRHQGFMSGDVSWANYEMDHCYPLLVRITL